MEYLTLSNGVKMYLEGFSVFQVSNPTVCRQAVLSFLFLLPSAKVLNS